jgi:cytochrome c biogenesis protein CcmG/thiol:disulfide interchange protein DsbE
MAGKTFGEIAIERMDAPGQFMTGESWQGKVAVVNVFASWCTPCRSEHKVLMELTKTGKVPIYGIAWKDPPEKTAKWLQVAGNPYQQIGMDRQGSTTVAIGMSGVPETYVLDAKGVVRFHRVSALRMEDVTRIILPLIDKLQAEAGRGR